MHNSRLTDVKAGPKQRSSAGSVDHRIDRPGALCAACGAWRGELGSEPTVEQYVANLVQVFRAVRRVLAPTGVLWLNIGDSYSNAGRAGSRGTKRGAGKPGWTDGGALGDKQLLLIPARVALALQADGWVLRNDVIWEKPNAMPSSVKDRLSTSYEHVFLFSKQRRYYYDADAIREPHARLWDARNGGSMAKIDHDASEARQIHQGNNHRGAYPLPNPGGRNCRDVWSISTESFEGSHFAVMPTELARRCILAGTSAAGQCAACGAPWARGGEGLKVHPEDIRALWHSTCRCDAGAPVPQVVADPFTGAGTVGVVALRHGRAFWGAELNPAYVEMANRRIADDCPLFNQQTEGAA